MTKVESKLLMESHPGNWLRSSWTILFWINLIWFDSRRVQCEWSTSALSSSNIPTSICAKFHEAHGITLEHAHRLELTEEALHFADIVVPWVRHIGMECTPTVQIYVTGMLHSFERTHKSGEKAHHHRPHATFSCSCTVQLPQVLHRDEQM